MIRRALLPVRSPLVLASAIIVVITIVFTWPQLPLLRSEVTNHDDSYFSAWRLAWIAHALTTDPQHLFDANIFYPEQRTLAYSDATLFQGLLAAPFLWAGWSPITLSNLMLLAGIASSGIGMFVLVKQLTANTGAALVAATAFTVTPYRIEHYMHLELQWTVWMPLAFWALHRATQEASWRFGALAGAFLWLQVLSCVYYGIFVGLAMGLLALLLVATRPRCLVRQTGALALGGALAIALSYPYSRPYAENTRTVGERDVTDIVHYSAEPRSYLTPPLHHWLWGHHVDPSDPDAQNNETHLFPGAIALALGVTAVVSRRRRLVLIYSLVAFFAVELSFGLNGALYTWLYDRIWVFHGLRAAARFAIVALCGLAVLIGFGVDELMRRAPITTRAWIAGMAILLLVVESGAAPADLEPVARETPPIYKEVRELGPAIILEMPIGKPPLTSPFDSTYVYWSTTHWNRLINGYSGYSPRTYQAIRAQLETFPDDRSISTLQALNVGRVIVHAWLYTPAEFTNLMLRMGRRPEFIPRGTYTDWNGRAVLFDLIRGHTP